MKHPEETCDDCGGQNVTWFAPPATWNAVIRPHGEKEADPMLCPTCFILRCEKAGMQKVWMVIPKGENTERIEPRHMTNEQ